MAAISTCEDAIRLATTLATANPQDSEMAHLKIMNEGRLANALRQSGRFADSIPHFRLALERLQELMRERPNDASLRLTTASLKFYMARSLSSLGDESSLEAYNDAVSSLEASLAGGSSDNRRVLTLSYALSRYAELLQRAHRSQEAEAAYERALSLSRGVALRPKAGAVELSGYAEALAKCPFPRLQDPALAMKLAERANELTRGATPTVLDSLAWAYFQNGRTEQAIRTARTALSLLPAMPNGGVRKDIEESLTHFEAGTQARR